MDFMFHFVLTFFVLLVSYLFIFIFIRGMFLAFFVLVFWQRRVKEEEKDRNNIKLGAWDVEGSGRTWREVNMIKTVKNNNNNNKYRIPLWSSNSTSNYTLKLKVGSQINISTNIFILTLFHISKIQSDRQKIKRKKRQKKWGDQATKSKPVSGIYPWFLLHFLLPGSCLEFLPRLSLMID